MSSSAFTPTTTQVTTEVPVNVPVVTAWQSYTPTYAAGAPTGTTLLGQWRRNGDTLEAKVRIQGSASSALSASTTSISWIPSASLTIDTTKLYSRAADRGWIGFGNAYGSFNDTTYTAAFAEPDGNPANIGILILKTVTNAQAYLRLNSSNFASTALNAADRYIELYVSAPIVQWSSGVTTLADRALEEYAGNGSAWVGSDTANFINGVNGSAITGALSTEQTKRVQFSTAIASTDRILLEVKESATAPWFAISDFISSATGYGIETYDSASLGTSSAGIGLRPVSGSSTQLTVIFGRYASNEAGGAKDWVNGWYWRVRKVSSGAQVGYPISTKNIVGATDGVAPVTGMLGESTAIAVATATSVPSGTVAITGLSQTLSAGTWAIFSDGTVTVVPPASGMTAGQIAYMDLRIQNTTDSTTLATASNVSQVQALSGTTVCGGSGSFSLSSIVQLSSPKTFQVQGTYQSNLTGGSTQTVRSGRMWAVRIA